jgi:transcriptional regulator with XRE-family HTH domain
MLVRVSTRTLVTPENKHAGILWPMETIGQRVRAVRLEKKLSQAKLGKAVGVSQQAIGQLETGDTRETALIAKIAKELGVSAYWLDTGLGPREDVQEDALNDDAAELVQIYEDLDGERRRMLKAMARDLRKAQGQ